MHPLFTPTCFLNLFHGGRGTYCILFCSIGIKLLISQVYHTISLYLSTNNQFTALFQLSIIPNSNSLKYVPHEQNIHFSNGRLFQNQKSIALKIHTCVRKSTFGHGTFFTPVFGIKTRLYVHQIIKISRRPVSYMILQQYQPIPECSYKYW